MNNVYVVVLAGGSGTRFWPASRRHTPKQLLPLGPGSGALLEQTVQRLLPITSLDRVYISTGERVLAATRECLPTLAPGQFLAEPVAKNTAPCIAWAAARVAHIDPEAIVVVVPSDQYIADVNAFHASLRLAIRSAQTGAITTLGVQPTRPETGYGYIEAGDVDGTVGDGVRTVKRFVEKPPLERAEEYLAAGNYFWNAGMFVFRAATMLEAIQTHAPELHAALHVLGAGVEAAEIAEFFARAPSDSIDYAIMEKVSRLNVVPADIGWSDLGSFQAAWELAGRDEAENALPSGAVAIDARRNLVMDLRTNAPAERTVALVGVSDLCVIETDDALLVVPRDRCQEVKAVVAQLTAAKRDSLL